VALFFDEQQFSPKLIKPIEKTIIPQKYEQPTAPLPSLIKRKEAPSAAVPYSQWNEEMINFTKDWIQQVLQIMGLGNIMFTTATSTNGLTFRFKSSIMGNEMKDRLLFSSFAHLILTMLRQKYKKAFRNLKVILITEPTHAT
jgi:hypothetical protein